MIVDLSGVLLVRALTLKVHGNIPREQSKRYPRQTTRTEFNLISQCKVNKSCAFIAALRQRLDGTELTRVVCVSASLPKMHIRRM